MNRLILIGNGFDLSHGLKTSYNDFIFWYMKKALTESYDNVVHNDPLINISRDPKYVGSPITDINDWIDKAYKRGFENVMATTSMGIWTNANNVNNDRPFKVEPKSKFIIALLSNCSYIKWVDIEAEYYSQLKTILNGKFPNATKEIELRDLNVALTELISQLEIYLTSLTKPEYDDRYMDILTSPILKKDVHGITIEKEEEPATTYLLNFNYTDTIKLYAQRFQHNSSQPIPIINYIHGKLGDEENRLIFGFGDEIDSAYLQMEQETAKGYFDYIKSFWYLRTSNYRELVSMVDAEPFQVYILGHSCGLSDRTMLHMIFEHPNCKSIKIYYHGDKKKNNYTNITYDIARHFKDKAEMRNKIVAWDRSENMQQY